MEDKPLISVVMPLYQSGSVLKETLQALYNVDYPKKKIEIIFSYYPSDDNTLNILEEFKRKHSNEYFDIKVLICKERGVSYARNIAIKESNGEYIFILDDDVAIHKDTFKRALDILAKEQDVAVVSFPYVLEKPSILEKAHLLTVKGKVRETRTFGGCAMVRRKVFNEIGLYNERLGPPYDAHEDLELSARINKLYKIITDGTIIQIHLPKKRYNSQDRITSSPSLNEALRYLKFYFTIGADTYELVLSSAPITWKIEMVIYFLIPLLFVVFVSWHFLLGLIYLAILLIIIFTYYDVSNMYEAFLSIVLLLGRIIKSYGYFTRKLFRTLKDLVK